MAIQATLTITALLPHAFSPCTAPACGLTDLSHLPLGFFRLRLPSPRGSSPKSSPRSNAKEQEMATAVRVRHRELSFSSTPHTGLRVDGNWQQRPLLFNGWCHHLWAVSAPRGSTNNARPGLSRHTAPHLAGYLALLCLCAVHSPWSVSRHRDCRMAEAGMKDRPTVWWLGAPPSHPCWKFCFPPHPTTITTSITTTITITITKKTHQPINVCVHLCRLRVMLLTLRWLVRNGLSWRCPASACVLTQQHSRWQQQSRRSRSLKHAYNSCR